MTAAREFLIEEPLRSGCIITALSPVQLGFVVTCQDDFYGFEDVKPVPLGKLLCDLGLSAADCERALEEWQRQVLLTSAGD